MHDRTRAGHILADCRPAGYRPGRAARDDLRAVRWAVAQARLQSPGL